MVGLSSEPDSPVFYSGVFGLVLCPNNPISWAKLLDLNTLHYFVVFIISSQQGKAMSNSSRTNQSICQLHSIAQKMLLNCKHCFGTDFRVTFNRHTNITFLEGLAENKFQQDTIHAG